MIDRHRSIATTAVIGLLFVVSGLAGCTTTESRARVIGRAGPVRDVAVIPAVDTGPVKVSAGKDVLTDDELAGLQTRLGASLSAIVTAEGTRATTDPVGLTGILRTGTLDAVRVKVKAAAGREQHRFMAECRLRVKAGAGSPDVLVDVEGSVLRLVQARNLSVVELPAIEQAMRESGGRHPLLELEDTEAAIVDACRAAIAAIVDDTRPEDAALDETRGRGVGRGARKTARLERRRFALTRLEQGLQKSPRANDTVAAALVDLGESGSVLDAPTISAFHHDEHPLVQRAARAALTSLCAGHSLLPAAEGAVARCTPPAPPPPPPPPPPPAVDDESADDAGPIRGAPDAGSAPPIEATTTGTTTEPAATTTTAPPAATDRPVVGGED